MLRALAREPATREALVAELTSAKGGHALLDAEGVRLMGELSDSEGLEGRSRFIVERLAIALEASVLVRAGNAMVSDAYCESRLGTAHGQSFGTLSRKVAQKALIDRALP